MKLLTWSTGETISAVKDEHYYNNTAALHIGNGLWSYGRGWTNWEWIAVNDSNGNAAPANAADTWRHVRLDVNPISKTSVEYTAYLENADGDLVQYSKYQTYRDYFTTDTSALMFVYNAKVTSVNTYFIIDNMKAYELNPVITPSVLNVEAENYDGTTTSLSEGMNNISSSTKRIAITFSQPLSETEESMKEKVDVYYSNLPDSERVYNWSGSFSSDKETYYISFENGAPVYGNTISIGIEPSVKGKTEVAQLSNDYTTYVSVNDDKQIKATDFILLKKVLGRTSPSGSIVIPDAWIPAKTYSDTDASEYKIVLKGYNTMTDDQEIIYIAAKYAKDPNGLPILSDADVLKDSVAASSGSFTKEYTNLPTLSEGESFKAFFWSYPDYQPLTKSIEK